MVKGFNSFADRYPELVPFYSPNNKRALDELKYSDSEWTHWVCPDCKGEYGAYLNEMANGTKKCPYCENDRFLRGFNSFNVLYPDLMKEYDYLNNYLITEPDNFSETTRLSLWWQCPKNPKHKYKMTPHNRIIFQKRHREPCPFCKGRRRKKTLSFRYQKVKASS